LELGYIYVNKNKYYKEVKNPNVYAAELESLWGRPWDFVKSGRIALVP
jgi:hypothetical protein